MRRKLRRTRSVFSKRRVPRGLKVFGTLVLCVAVVAAGFFVAKYATEHGKNTTDSEAIQPLTPPTSNKPDSGTNSPSSDKEDVSTQPDDEQPQAPASLDTIRGFYLPHSTLQSDTLPATLTAARKAGFNAVLFDLKDADGNLYYQFSNAQAKKVNSYTSDALTAEGLTALFDTIRECGLLPIPRLYAFRDDLAAKVLSDARIGLVSNHTWAWYDGDPNNGGKKWLNPYSATAQSYIQGLAEELKAKGAAAVMLDSVQFPDKLDKNAYLGDVADLATERAATLTAFIEATRTRLGTDCPLLLSCTEKGALATDTKVYGGNPLTFGASIASPLLTSKWQDAVEKMILRTQVLEQKTTLAPMVKADGLTAAKVNDAISGVVAGGTQSFILYCADGTYDFAAYDLP